jgi:glycosyltransferase involved in cell wall biosynthesis
MNSLKDQRIALVYDRVNKWGGAERILLALHELFPQAPLYTSVYCSSQAKWARRFLVKTSFLQNFHFIRNKHEYLAPLMPIIFESFSFDAYDLVISVTSEAAKGIITKPKTKHICYCLTPTRYLWSSYKDYFTNPFFSFLVKPMIAYLRKWDLIAAQRPDKIIAISREVQARVRKYYKREAEVVYPPVVLANSKWQMFPIKSGSRMAKTIGTNVKLKQKDCYFLIVSRLVPYKRIDLAIKACNELKLSLVIIGIGSEEQKLKRIAKSTIRFTDMVPDSELFKYYANCKALIFPGLEDFGLTMVEAQMFGKPVIAYKAGGALEIVVDHETGILFSPQTKDALKAALKEFITLKFKKEDCHKQAEKFSFDIFKKQFISTVKDLYTK